MREPGDGGCLWKYAEDSVSQKKKLSTGGGGKRERGRELEKEEVCLC